MTPGSDRSAIFQMPPLINTTGGALGGVVLGHEAAAEHRLDADDVERVRRDEPARVRFGQPVVAADDHRAVLDQRHPGERAARARASPRSPGTTRRRSAPARVARVDPHDPIGLVERQAAQQHGVDEREHRAVGADAERERGDGRQREPPILDEPTGSANRRSCRRLCISTRHHSTSSVRAARALSSTTAPVEQVNIALGMTRVARIVRDHADGRAARCSSPSKSITDSPLFESRLPVGSSASSIAGSPATARATATRCCWPPDSWLGRCFGAMRHPDPFEGGRGRVRAARGQACRDR